MAVVVGYERQWDARVIADRSVVQRLKLKQQRPVFRIKVEYTKGSTGRRDIGGDIRRDSTTVFEEVVIRAGGDCAWFGVRVRLL